MELGTIIITICVIIACVIPFVLISRSNKKKAAAVLQKLSRLADASHTEILHHDIWYNTIIGADEGPSRLFFSKKTGELELDQQVQLAEVKSCHINQVSRTLSSPEGDHKITEKLELVFSFRDKEKMDTVFAFYDVGTDSLALAGELQLINKWSKLVNDRLKSMS